MAERDRTGKSPGPSRFEALASLPWLWLAGFLLTGTLTLLSLAALAAPRLRAGLPADFDDRAVATLAGFFFAVFAFLFNAWQRERQSRKQHTVKILFDTRLSSEFRQHLEWRKHCFPEGQLVGAETYFDYLEARRSAELSDDRAFERRKSAEAIRSLLNYYEFIALGIRSADLDEAMMYNTVRGIMCNLIADMHEIVAAYRHRDPRTYRHLVALYARWKSPGQPVIG